MRSRLQIVDTTDNASPELVTLAALKLELGITGDDEDDALNARITRESLLAAEYCGRVFALSNAIETFTFDAWPVSVGYAWDVPLDRQVLNLSLYPIQQIDSITVDGTALGEDDFEYDAASGRLWRPSGAYWAGVVEVNYWGGYDLPDGAPASLASAVIEAVSNRRDAVSGEAQIRDISHGDTKVGYYSTGSTATAGLSSSVRDMLAPFKRPAMA